MLLLLLIVGQFRLLHSHILLELVEQGRELSLQVIIDLSKLLDFVTEVALLFHQSFRVHLKRVASSLEV